MWLSVVLLLAFAAPAAEARHYRCLDDTTFVLRVTDQLAIVEFSDGAYRLPRRPSGIAVKYASEQATLYLDGEFAAFVAEDRPLPGCIQVRPDERG